MKYSFIVFVELASISLSAHVVRTMMPKKESYNERYIFYDIDL